MGVMLSTHGLAIGYPGHPVGEGIDLSVGAGEVLCLLGPNGSGKTTLFQTLLGLLPARGGEVRIGGTPIARMTRAEIARQAAYVPQAQNPAFAFEVREMVLMGRTAHLGPFAQPGPEDLRAADAALAQLGILDLATSDITRLSGGQRQLVLIARALAQQSRIVVMDEPTASLDFGNQALVMREIARLSAEGLSIVLSTHDPDHALAVGTRVALLHGGRIVATGTPREALTPGRLAEVYGIAVTVETLADGRTICVPDLGAQGLRRS